MKRAFRPRHIVKTGTCFCLALLLCISFSSAYGSPEPAVIPPVAVSGLVDLLSKALPVVEKVVAAAFKGTTPNGKQKENIDGITKDTEKGLSQLQAYLKQEQLLAVTVTSTGTALSSVAVMNQVISGQDKLSGPQITRFNKSWNTVKATLDRVNKTNLDTSVLSDSNEKIVITKIVDADGDLKADIEDFLKKYKANATDETSVAQLHETQDTVKELLTRFENLSDVSAVALKTVADSLAAVVNAAAEQKSTGTTPGKKPKINTGEETLFKSPEGFKVFQKFNNDHSVAIEKSLERPDKGTT